MLGEIKKDVSFEVKAIEKEIAELYAKKGDIVRGKSNGSSVKEVEKEIKRLMNKKEKILSAPKENDRNLTLDEITKHRIKESQRKLSELKKLQKEFFNAENRNLKKQLREKIDKIEWELIEETLKEQGNLEAMQKLSQYKKNKAKPFFLWKLYFSEVFTRENPGFDVVIANPPYDVLNESATDTLQREFNEQIRNNPNFSFSLGGKLNLYRLFIEKGYHLIREEVSLTFIVPSTILADKGTIGIRKLIKERTELKFFIEFPEKTKVFENVTQATTIFSFRKLIQDSDFLLSIDCQTKHLPPHDAIITNLTEIFSISCDDLTIPLAKNKKEYSILKKIHNNKIPLKDIAYFKQGDINLTFHQKYLSDINTGYILVRGIHISR